MLVGEHDHRVADRKLGVCHLAVRRHEAHSLFCAEGAPVKLDRIGRLLQREVRGYGTVTIGNGLHGHESLSPGLARWIARLECRRCGLARAPGALRVMRPSRGQPMVPLVRVISPVTQRRHGSGTYIARTTTPTLAAMQ